MPPQYADYIHVETECAKLKFDFSVAVPESETVFDAVYEFKLKKEKDESDQNISEVEHDKAVLFDETLSCSYIHGEEKGRMSYLIRTGVKEVFAPKSKYQELLGKDKELETDLQVAKRLAFATARSFIFSKELLTAIRQHCRQSIYQELLETLVQYGNFELFVINTQNNGSIAMNVLTLAFKYESGNAGAAGNIMLPLDRAETIPKETADLIGKMIPNMNMVLFQIVPGLTISIYNFGPQVLKNGKIGCRVQLMSRKNSREIPFCYESEGIKK